jgi:hypothetical protein
MAEPSEINSAMPLANPTHIDRALLPLLPRQ